MALRSLVTQVRLGDCWAFRDRLPSSAGSDEESVADSDEEKAHPCAYATRSRGDLLRPLWWTVSLLELNLAAELFLALTRQLKQSWIHDVFLSWKRNANVQRSCRGTRDGTGVVGARSHAWSGETARSKWRC